MERLSRMGDKQNVSDDIHLMGKSCDADQGQFEAI